MVSDFAGDIPLDRRRLLAIALHLSSVSFSSFILVIKSDLRACVVAESAVHSSSIAQAASIYIRLVTLAASSAVVVIAY